MHSLKSFYTEKNKRYSVLKSWWLVKGSFFQFKPKQFMSFQIKSQNCNFTALKTAGCKRTSSNVNIPCHRYWFVSWKIIFRRYWLLPKTILSGMLQDKKPLCTTQPRHNHHMHQGTCKKDGTGQSIVNIPDQLFKLYLSANKIAEN